jgi:hypothetical protein
MLGLAALSLLAAEVFAGGGETRAGGGFLGGSTPTAGSNSSHVRLGRCDSGFRNGRVNFEEEFEDPKDAKPCPCGVGTTCLTCDVKASVCEYACLPAGQVCSAELINHEDEELEEERMEEEEHEMSVRMLSFSMVMLFLVLTAVGLHAMHLGWLQESMAFILVGMLVALLLLLVHGKGTSAYVQGESFSADDFFLLLLPPIIFEAGYSMKKARFIRNFETILLFAFVGSLISTFVIGGVLYLCDSLKFGAMISATDPVATLSVLSSMRPMKDPDLYSLIFGESVLNDAIACVRAGPPTLSSLLCSRVLNTPNQRGG